MSDIRKVRVMINPSSGTVSAIGRLYQGLERDWNIEGIDLTYQVSRSAKDGREKAERAIADGVDTILVAGGDGMVNSIGSVMVGSETKLGVIPTGSGNGFARHFDIPLNCLNAIKTLKHAREVAIDVGTLNGKPFFVTASMAWDAALVEHFERSPVRGVIPYVFSGFYGYFDYVPQPVRIELDGGDVIDIQKPMILTVANLTQYGGGAKIAPRAQPDDGVLELVAMNKSAAGLLANLPHLFDGTLGENSSVITRSFSKMKIIRERAAPVQMDGELVEAAKDLEISLLPRALKVLVPMNRVSKKMDGDVF